MQDRTRQDIECTSKHRTLGQVDWSRQLSREVAPYFVPQPCPQSRVQLGNGAEAPKRHMGALDMERSAPKSIDPEPDTRDYNPKLYEELHPRCGVDIGRAPTRKAVFDAPQHSCEVVVDVERFPGWGLGKNSSLSQARRAPPTPRTDRSIMSPTPTLSAYTPIPATVAFEATESRLARTTGGYIPRSQDRKLTSAPDHKPLDVRPSVVERHSSTLSLDHSSRHFARRKKFSDRYREMFRTPPPPPLSTPDPTRKISGYAPQRQSFDRSVSSLLATADADRRRAKKLMMQNFGSGSQSAVRSAVLYTPSPDVGGVEGSDDAAASQPSPQGRPSRLANATPTSLRRSY
jgi:hypothetical protein